MKAWQTRPRPDLLQRLPECVATISRLTTTCQIGQYMATEVTDMLGADFGGHALHDLETNFNEIAARDRPTSDVLQAGANLYEFNHQLPHATEALAGELRRFTANIEQEMSIPDFKGLEVYEHVYKLLGGPYVIIHHSEPVERVWAGGCFVRKTSGFSEDETRFIDALSAVTHLRSALIAKVEDWVHSRCTGRECRASRGGQVIFDDVGAIYHASAGGGEAIAQARMGSAGIYKLPEAVRLRAIEMAASRKTTTEWRLGNGRKLVLEKFRPNAEVRGFEGHFRLVEPGSEAPMQLTQREAEVAHWVAQGKTNVEIATILGISPRTVAKHVEHILEKLKLENRVALALHWRGRSPRL